MVPNVVFCMSCTNMHQTSIGKSFRLNLETILGNNAVWYYGTSLKMGTPQRSTFTSKTFYLPRCGRCNVSIVCVCVFVCVYLYVSLCLSVYASLFWMSYIETCLFGMMVHHDHISTSSLSIKTIGSRSRSSLGNANFTTERSV